MTIRDWTRTFAVLAAGFVACIALLWLAFTLSYYPMAHYCYSISREGWCVDNPGDSYAPELENDVFLFFFGLIPSVLGLMILKLMPKRMAMIRRWFSTPMFVISLISCSISAISFLIDISHAIHSA